MSEVIPKEHADQVVHAAGEMSPADYKHIREAAEQLNASGYAVTKFVTEHPELSKTGKNSKHKTTGPDVKTIVAAWTAEHGAPAK